MTFRTLLAAVLALALCTACDDPNSSEAPSESTEAADAAATDESPAGGAATVQSAIARLQAGDAPAAVEILEGLASNDGAGAQVHYWLGFARSRAERPDAARESFETALELDPTLHRARLELARLQAKQGDLEGALASLEALDGETDLSQVPGDRAFSALAEDPELKARFEALQPSAAEIDDPFVEETTVIHEWRGEGPGDEFGWIARDVGDVDGDGVHDLTTSAPSWGAAEDGQGSKGKVYVYSGRSGELLWSAEGQEGWQLGRGIEAAGDVDADGVPDVVAGAPGADRVVVYAGDRGEAILELEGEEKEAFGRKVSDVGDVDGDGHADVLVGAPQNDRVAEDAGRAVLYSGADGTLLAEWLGETAGDAFGSSGAGGVHAETGERRGFVLVGAPNAGDDRGGRVYVYEISSEEAGEEPLYVLSSDDKASRLGGMFVSVVGDVDADGMPDLYASDWAHGAKGRQTGKIHVVSGADGSRVLALEGEAAGDGFGIGPADAGDVDGDGHADLVIGAWQHASAAPAGGKVYLYGGADAELIRTWTSKVMGETFGFDATGMGDVDGDGTVDLLLTSGWSPANGPRSGRMFLVSSR